MENTFVLKNRDFFLLFVGSVVSNLGTQIFNFSMALYILFLTDGDAIQAGFYMAFGGIVFFVFTPFAGALVDRLNKVMVVYLTDIINGITIIIVGYFIFQGLTVTNTIIMLYVASLILGINSALFNPAARSLPAHILEENQLQQSSSLSQGMGALYGIIGPIIGGIVYGIFRGDIEIIFWINGISFVLSGVSEYFIKTNTKPDEEDNTITFKRTLVDIKSGFQYLWKLKGIRNLLLIAALLNFFTVPVIVNGFPYLFIVVLEAPTIYYSTLMASFPVGIIISSILLGTRKQKDLVSPLLIMGMYGMAISFTVFAFASFFMLSENITLIIFMIISVLSTIGTGFFNGYVNVPFSVAIMKSVEKPMMGRVFSATSILSNGITPIAIALGGVAISFIGVQNLIWIACVAMFVTATLAYRDKEIKEI